MQPNPMIREGLAPPPPSARTTGCPFLKLHPGQRQSITILSPHWTGAITHYASGRMKLCSPHDCPYCTAGQKTRWYAWLHVFTPKTVRQWICQLASGQHGPLLSAHDTYGTLRGCPATLERTGRSPNSPLHVHVDGPPTIGNHLPPPIDLPSLLAVSMDWHTATTPPDGHPEALEGGKQQ